MDSTTRPRHRLLLGRSAAVMASAMRSRPVVVVLASILLATGVSAVAVHRNQIDRAVAADVASVRATHDQLDNLVAASAALCTVTAVEDSAAAARTAVLAALVPARALLLKGSGDTTEVTARLRAAVEELQAAHDSWMSASEAAGTAAAELAASEAAAAQAAASQAEADRVSAEKAAADEAAAAKVAARKAASAKTTVPQAAVVAPVSPDANTNGRIDPARLCAIPFLPDHQVLCRSLGDLVAFSNAYRAVFGTDLPIDPWPESCYRSYDQQVATFARYGAPRAARPGTSNHGWGTALDINDVVDANGLPVYDFGTPGYVWMVANGPRFGWASPDWALEGGVNPEPWHFEFVR